jgi:hypothetical protein
MTAPLSWLSAIKLSASVVGHRLSGSATAALEQVPDADVRQVALKLIAGS